MILTGESQSSRRETCLSCSFVESSADIYMLFLSALPTNLRSKAKRNPFNFSRDCMCVCTRWFKYDRDYLCVNKSQFVPVIFEPPCIYLRKRLVKCHIWSIALCDAETGTFRKVGKKYLEICIKVSGLLPGVILGSKPTFQDLCLSLLEGE